MNPKILIEPHDESIIEFVVWSCDYLCCDPLSITICYVDGLHVRGMCIDDTNDTFTILIKSDKRSYEDVLMTVAHELVHVKQYMQNDLGMLLDKHKDLDYDKRWWEHEAVAVSRQMVGLYGLHH